MFGIYEYGKNIGIEFYEPNKIRQNHIQVITCEIHAITCDIYEITSDIYVHFRNFYQSSRQAREIYQS